MKCLECDFDNDESEVVCLRCGNVLCEIVPELDDLTPVSDDAAEELVLYSSDPVLDMLFNDAQAILEAEPALIDPGSSLVQ